MKELERARLTQAHDALVEAEALLEGDMDAGFVLTHLYYAFYYPILALMNEGQVPTTMQSVTIGLFDQRYISTGVLRKEYGDAVRRIFDTKPKCSGETIPVTRAEVDALLGLARSFRADVERYLTRR